MKKPPNKGKHQHFMQVAIRDLCIPCIIGVYEFEKQAPQPLYLDIALSIDATKAVHGDQLTDTIDYVRISDDIEFILTTARFELLETAAFFIARFLVAPLAERGGIIHEATVVIKKPAALGPRGVAQVSYGLRSDEGDYKIRSAADQDYLVVAENNKIELAIRLSATGTERILITRS